MAETEFQAPKGFTTDENFALEMDKRDPLRDFQNEFLYPESAAGAGKRPVYFVGNSLGLQPRKARSYIQEELERWAKLGVEGHFIGKNAWFSYHDSVVEPMARVVGAKPIEVAVMNTLTVNLHLMMVSFYRPTRERFKIMVEAGAFPSDQYAVASQARFHGFDPAEAIIELRPREGEALLRDEDILAKIDRHGPKTALILLGNVNYLTGQAFDIAAITEAGHRNGCKVGFDLAHGAGNLELRLHDWGPDFAVWCNYKYLNSGPGALAGCFVHERHASGRALPRFEGWWGHNKATRFKMGPTFDPVPGAEGWQLSNPPILQLASIRASLELFDNATMSRLRKKSQVLTDYLHYLLRELAPEKCSVITPSDSRQRGAQLSLRVQGGRELLKKLGSQGVFCDFREPDVIRAAPAPIYNSFEDVFRFARILSGF